MHVLLPPSESKAAGGRGPALSLLALHLPELRAHRDRLITLLTELSDDLPSARLALKVTAASDAHIQQNTRLRSAATLPALYRYTGVLFDALDVGDMTPAERSRAQARSLIMSALFGAVRGGDLIPEYRLSAGSRLPGLGTIASWWKPVLTPALRGSGAPVLDLRSGAYAALADIPQAITVRVVTEHADGSRRVVSHFSKHTKGLLARAVLTPRREIDTVDDVIAAAVGCGLRIEQTAPSALEVVTEPRRSKG